MKNYLKKSLAIVSSIILSSSLGVFADGEGKEEPSASESVHSSSEDIKQSLEDRIQKLEQEVKNITSNSEISEEQQYKLLYKKVLEMQQLIFEWHTNYFHDELYFLCYLNNYLRDIYCFISKKQIYKAESKFYDIERVLTSTFLYARFWDASTYIINETFEEVAEPINEAMILYSGLENFEAAHITKLYEEGKIYDDHKDLKKWIKETMSKEHFQELHSFKGKNCRPKAISHLYNLENLNIVYQFEEIPECRKDFISTTTDLKTAMKFAYWFSKESENMVILKINVPENSNVEMLAMDYMNEKYKSTDHQYEFVLKGDERFKIKGITEKEMTYIKPHSEFQCRGKFTIIEADLLPREK